MVRRIAPLVLCAVACARKEPPGAEPSVEVSSALASELSSAQTLQAQQTHPRPTRVGSEPRAQEGESALGAKPDPSNGGAADRDLGNLTDALPFQPTGLKLGSIAWRTWVYTDTGPKRTRLGYLRAGAVVDARGPKIENAGCEGGWYRVNPRGFVCVGKGATLNWQNDLVVRASAIRPERGKGLPYIYAMASDDPPFMYFRFPRKEEMIRVEGDRIDQHSAAWQARETWKGTYALLGTLTEPPEDLRRVSLVKPYGVKEGLHLSVHSGRASPDSGFALARAYSWEGRVFGLTTELSLIALDRTRLVKPSTFHGVELLEGEDLPAGMVSAYETWRFTITGMDVHKDRKYQHRDWVKLTGKVNSGPLTLLGTVDGGWVAKEGLRLVTPRDSFPSYATGSRKWIDISIRDQSLVAYQGKKAVYVTLVSTGRGALGDPATTFATVRGTFMVHTKHVSATMDGDEDKQADSYALEDVPFVQYFHEGFALHGTYWHDDFGKVRSHGCVNLAPQDAAWLFEWTDPGVPADWHGALNMERGTVVYIHP